MMQINKVLFLFVAGVSSVLHTSAQFVDNFDSLVPTDKRGWQFMTGDGSLTMDFIQKNGYASVHVDATGDKRNIWWALIKHEVPEVDINQLIKPGYELRVEAKIKISHAPRRVNLHFNHQRTTDFHSHLMEYDISDTTNWHVISMTTQDFDALPGDRINVQMALMDWGLKQYRVDIDYFKVDLVVLNNIGPDKGDKLPYHPALVDPKTFHYHVPVVHDAMIDKEFPNLNFNNWTLNDNSKTKLLTVSGSQIVLLRWDLNEFRTSKVVRSGLLELMVHSLQKSTDFQKDFGMVRISEIIGGKPDWDQEKITLNSLCLGRSLDYVINTQMTIDSQVAPDKNNKSFFTISYPVLQRMIEGKTLGLAIGPLGAVNAAFYSSENQSGKFAAKLHFDTE